MDKRTVFTSYNFNFIYLFILFLKKIILFKVDDNYHGLTIAISGFSFILASLLAFLPDVFLQRGDTTIHFFLTTGLLYAFLVLSGDKVEK